MFEVNDDDFFFDDALPQAEEDTILPDDIAQEEPQEEVTEPVEDTPETEEVTEPVQEPQKLQLKYNKEIREVTLEEAAELAQKGLNYDKIQERLNALQTDPRLSFVEELARDNNMTVDQYLDAVKQHREQQRLNELIQQNIPEEYAKEILENRKFREQLQSKEKEQQQQQKQQAEFSEFVEAFPGVKPEDVPAEVWEAQAQGTPLKFAYMQHEYNQLQTKMKVLQQNQTNAQRAPVGSVTAHGSENVAPEDDFLKGFNSI